MAGEMNGEMTGEMNGEVAGMISAQTALHVLSSKVVVLKLWGMTRLGGVSKDQGSHIRYLHYNS